VFLKYNIPTLVWATVVLFLTLLPSSTLPQVPEWDLLNFYTASHAGVFFLLAVLMERGFTKQTRFGFLRRYAFLLTFLVCLIFGILIEILQTLMAFGRQGELFDVIANSIGIFLGVCFYYFLLRRSPISRYF
jgi:VanZ family protein